MGSAMVHAIPYEPIFDLVMSDGRQLSDVRSLALQDFCSRYVGSSIFPRDYRFSGTTYEASAGVEATVIENTTL